MIEKSLDSEIKRQPSAGPKPQPNVGVQVRLYEVEIAGVPLRLKSSHDEQTVNELVALVDEKIREALPLTKTGSVQNASILASLHLAEEYILLQRKVCTAKAELDGLEAKTLKVISELESSRVMGINN